MQAFAGGGVHGGKRLVQQQNLRLGGEGAGDGHALLLAARDLVGAALREVIESHAFEQPRGDRPAFMSRARGVGHVVENGHVRKQRVVLEDVPDAPVPGGDVDRPLARFAPAEEDRVIESNLTAIRRGETGDAAERHRLAGPRWAE